MLARFQKLENIPDDHREWGVKVTSAMALGTTLHNDRKRAMLFRTLATLRTDIPLFKSVDELKWSGPTEAFAPLAARLDGAAKRGGLSKSAEKLRR